MGDALFILTIVLEWRKSLGSCTFRDQKQLFVWEGIGRNVAVHCASAVCVFTS